MTELSHEELEHLCGRTVSFVFAPNKYSADKIYDIGELLRACHVAAIFLMADASAADEAVEAMRMLGRKGRGAMVQAAEFDFDTVYGADTSNPAFHLEQLPDDLLGVMRTLSQSVLDIYESVLVVDASQPLPTQEQLIALYQSNTLPNFEQSPYLLSRAYLENLAD